MPLARGDSESSPCRRRLVAERTGPGGPNPRPTDWTLDAEALGRFLLLLDNDISQAAKRYERLRLKLIHLFEWRGAVFAEDLADETLNRVIRRFEQGVDLDASSVQRFSAGVAHRVFLEHLREVRRRSPAPPAETHPPWVARGRQTTDLRLRHLDGCLARLSADERALILRYYGGEPSQRMARRRKMAEELDIQPGHLRIRAFRIRNKLERWIQQAMDPSATSSGAGP